MNSTLIWQQPVKIRPDCLYLRYPALWPMLLHQAFIESQNLIGDGNIRPAIMRARKLHCSSITAVVVNQIPCKGGGAIRSGAER